GSNRRMLEKAPRLGADVVFIDLEDAVSPDEKVEARANAIEAVNDHDWGAAAVAVRINGLDTPWCYRDIIEVVEQAGRRLDLVIVPKVGSAADLHLVATLLTQIEAAVGLDGRIGLTALVETAIGVARVEEIAQACPDRLEAIVFGVADYAASIQAPTTNIGGVSRGYSVLTDPDPEADGERAVHWGDPWHYALARIAVAARAYGVRPLDGPFGDFRDPDGLLASAHRAAALGCEGKWAIHPAQIDPIHEVFTPDEAAVGRARRIIAAMEQGADAGMGAVSVGGRMVDAASVKMAEHLLAKVAQIHGQGGDRSPTSG
ncbi:MAG TPA: CoA ester lyase, partial [Solirubrobacteraceae bacterium]|nr:CoA ester lyase [Solirubrobacteraceae bacterium]